MFDIFHERAPSLSQIDREKGQKKFDKVEKNFMNLLDSLMNKPPETGFTRPSIGQVSELYSGLTGIDFLNDWIMITTDTENNLTFTVQCSMRSTGIGRNTITTDTHRREISLVIANRKITKITYSFMEDKKRYTNTRMPKQTDPIPHEKPQSDSTTTVVQFIRDQNLENIHDWYKAVTAVSAICENRLIPKPDNNNARKKMLSLNFSNRPQ